MHHLFLIDNDAQRLLQNLLQLRKFVFDPLAPMFAVNEVINHAALDRARPIQCIQSRQVLNRAWFIPPQHIAHAMRFKLKYAGSKAAMKHLLVRGLVLQRNALQHDFLASNLFQQLDSVIENRQCGQPKKIHLEQPHLLDSNHVERGDNFVVLRPIQRHQFLQRPRRDHDSRRMDPGVPYQSFQLFRGVNQLPNLCIAFVSLLQRRRLLDCVLQLDIQRGRHHLRDAVNVAIGNIHRTSHVFDRGLRRHCAEGDDLRDIFSSVLPRDVINDLTAPVHAEIHVYVRHGNSLWIQETLEK